MTTWLKKNWPAATAAAGLTLAVVLPLTFVGYRDYRHSFAPPSVALPAEVKLAPGGIARVTAGTDCAAVYWEPSDGLTFLDYPGTPAGIANATKAGNYRLTARVARGGKIACATAAVTVGDAPPPGPPAPPAPTDPLTAALQAAYAQDADADKSASLAFLQTAYAGMAAAAGSWADAKTNADALARIKAVVGAPGVGLTANQVTHLRRAVAAELARAFGTAANTPVNPAGLTGELNKIASALKGVR